jgi:hypothetical protein
MSTLAVNTLTPATGSSVSIPAFVPSSQFSHRNKIINGKMDIAQRGTNFPAIAGGTYSLDRWIQSNGTTAVLTISQQADAPSSNEFQNSLRITVTPTADTSIAAGEQARMVQFIEGYNARDLIGKTFTLSFWVRSSKTGIHCVGFRNGGAVDRSYVTEYTISAANTWEYKTITVIGGLITAGTWNWTNGIGLEVCWTLASGTTTQTTANAWQTGSYTATANQVNCLDTVGNIFAITGVQLEVGSVATPFEHRPVNVELALCQRYYYRISAALSGTTPFGICYGTSTQFVNVLVHFPVTMRTRPTALEHSGTASHYSATTGNGGGTLTSVPVFYYSGTDSCVFYGISTTAPFVAGYGGHFHANSTSAYLGWSAEL